MKRFISLTLFALLVVLAGCRSAPVEDVDSEPLRAPQTATLDQIKKGIMRAGALQNWDITEVSPGHLLGQLLVSGKHLAVVDIFFDTEVFSIRYKDSRNLNYNGDTIHSNYNRWVMGLRQSIQREMRLITPPAAPPTPEDEGQEVRNQQPRESADSERDPASDSSEGLKT